MPSYQAPNSNNSIENRDDCIVLINESFENGFPPENWTNFEWQDSLYGAPYHGDHWAYSWAFADLTTFPIEFGVDTTLTFWYRAESATHPIEGFEVYVNDTLVWSDDYSNHVEYEMVTVHLDSYSGLKTITFSTFIGDFYGMCLDMITVTTKLIDVYVDDDFNSSTPGWQYDHFNIIQDGIDAVAEGGTVYVYNGTYYENVTINKTIQLIGEHKTLVTIDGMMKNSVININASNVTVSGFTLHNSSEYSLGPNYKGGIKLYEQANHSTISNNTLRDNDCGIYIYSSNNTIQNNDIQNNTNFGVSIFQISGTNNNIINNCIEQNWIGMIIGDCLPDGAMDTLECNIIHNIVTNNEIGLYVESSGNTIKENTVENNINGIVIIEGSVYDGPGNQIFHNNFINNTIQSGCYNGYMRPFGSINLDKGPIIGGNYWDDYTGVDTDEDGIGDNPYYLEHRVELLLDDFDMLHQPEKTIIDGDESGYTWELTTTLPSWTVDPVGSVSDNMMIMDDDAAGDNNNIGYDKLVYGLNCTGLSDIQVEFDGTYNDYGYNNNFTIDVNNATAVVFNEDTGFGDIDHVTISPHANNIDMNLSFTYNDGLKWAWGVVIDNIRVTGTVTDFHPFMEPNGWKIEIDVNQSIQDRGFPIRHAADGDWAGAQNYLPMVDIISKAEIYLRKFGTPEFNLTVELREDAIDGPVLDTLVFTPDEVPSTWTWLELDFNDVTVTPGVDYFIKCPPAPSGVTTSFGYEWGYAFGNHYDDGAFWFTRDSGNLWRDLPTMYEFAFKIFGYE